ncbi:hypothetical protein MPSEU_001060200 [Mayamaea pseudoterrestris]|nr:hypothetical protein MPSEU_001060200 [Mayamaea pseudoterrestris]
MHDAEKDFHLASTRVTQLKDEHSKETLDLKPSKRQLSSTVAVETEEEASQSTSETPSRPVIKPVVTQQPVLDTRINHGVQQRKRQFASAESECCSYTIQDMSNLSCYNVRLTNSSSRTYECPQIQLMHSPANEATAVSIKFDEGDILRISFPGHIAEVSSQPIIGDSGITLRCSYRPNSRPPFDDLSAHHRLTAEAAETLTCRYCDHSLIVGSNNDGTYDDKQGLAPIIHSVGPLPSSRWDDMMDYLTCYPGQSAVDFNTAMICGQAGRILEDETALVAHAPQVQASVLHGMPGYGQAASQASPVDALTSLDGDASLRGVRPWRDSVVGPVVACNYCASILGSCPSPETVRLLKHRLQVTATGEVDVKVTQLSTIAIFMAQEMIRYAETKAIFAFRVRQASRHTKTCLVLRLISWDNFVATNKDATLLDDDIHSLHWKRMVQVVYEETMDIDPFDESNTKNLWMWSTDWCCEPIAVQHHGDDKDEKKTSSTNSPVSAVNLTLEADEWKELSNEIKSGSAFFPAAVAAATVMAKTGSERASLSAIFLP